MKTFTEMTIELQERMLRSIKQREEIQGLCGYTDEEMKAVVEKVGLLIKEWYL